MSPSRAAFSHVEPERSSNSNLVLNSMFERALKLRLELHCYPRISRSFSISSSFVLHEEVSSYKTRKMSHSPATGMYTPMDDKNISLFGKLAIIKSRGLAASPSS
jgi:hypothetical protein